MLAVLVVVLGGQSLQIVSAQDASHAPTKATKAAAGNTAGNSAPRQIENFWSVGEAAADQLRAGADTVEVAISRDALRRLYLAPEPTLVGGLRLSTTPAESQQDSFLVEPFEVFATDATVIAFDGVTETPLSLPAVQAYRGESIDGSEREMTLIVSEAGSAKIVLHEPGQPIVSIVENVNQHRATPSRGNYVASFGIRPPATAPSTLCRTGDLARNQAFRAEFQEPAPLALLERAQRGEGRGTTQEAELLIDVDNRLFVNAFGSDAARAALYTTELIASASAVYQREVNAALKLRSIVVWTEPDPFDANSTNPQLDSYREYNVANRGDIDRTAAHLLGGRGLGGLAWLGVLCNEGFGYGVSHIDANIDFPHTGFAFDIFLVSHELGHNFGSDHTHCYNPPIDCCYAEECDCGPATSQPGTIMSYCLFTNSVSLDFHPRVQDVITAHIATRTCVDDHAPVTTGNDDFANSTPMPGLTGMLTASSSSATKESGEPNHAGNAGGRSMWWNWVATADGTITVETSGTTFDTTLGAYAGNAVGALTELGSNDDIEPGVDFQSRVQVAVETGDRIHLAVDGYDGESGAITLSWEFRPGGVATSGMVAR